MSFSGLKTAVINLAHHCEQTGETLDRAGLAASLCRAVSESLVPRTMAAAAELGYKKIAVAGGVAANSRIRADFAAAAEKAGEVINAAEDLPRSFVLCEEGGERRVWLSSLSSAALSRR